MNANYLICMLAYGLLWNTSEMLLLNAFLQQLLQSLSYEWHLKRLQTWKVSSFIKLFQEWGSHCLLSVRQQYDGYLHNFCLVLLGKCKWHSHRWYILQYATCSSLFLLAILCECGVLTSVFVLPFSVAWSAHVLISSSRTWRSGRTTCCPQDSSGENDKQRYKLNSRLSQVFVLYFHWMVHRGST